MSTETSIDRYRVGLHKRQFTGRLLFCGLLLCGGFLFLAGRAVQLNILNTEFLKGQGDARVLRVIAEPAHRGMILDRNGEPLAISTPVKSVWADPRQLLSSGEGVRHLAGVLGLDFNLLQQTLRTKQEREFVYLKRHITPDLEGQVNALHLPGVGFQREYRRYYPSREVSAHFLGLTNVDDVGQEGVELAFDSVLRGVSGSKRVIKDNLDRYVEDVENVKTPIAGADVVVSLDRRLQYLAYRELKNAVELHKANSGSLVALDARSGEVLAMTNYPAFNPNNREKIDSAHFRNRVLSDPFEPGSTVKPFTVLAGMETGKFNVNSTIDTRPGLLQLGRDQIKDHHDLGEISLETLLQKSSNVGAAKVALAIEPERLWQVFTALGFGQARVNRLSGESIGALRHYQGWRDIERATLSYGYGLSITALQLARAYTIFGNDGRLKTISFEKKALEKKVFEKKGLEKKIQEKSTGVDSNDGENPGFKLENIIAIRHMLESVTLQAGTGNHAAVPGYRVAGKTGTVEKLGESGYQSDKHIALFSGLAPASDPRLVIVVVIDEPKGREYFGGGVAAPVFAKVMSGALRMLNVAPDAIEFSDSKARVALLEQALDH